MENTSYCLKCKSKKEMTNVQLKTNKKGVKYLKSNCKDCNCKMNKFISSNYKIDVVNNESSSVSTE